MEERPEGSSSRRGSRKVRVEPRLWPWLLPLAACLAFGGVGTWAVGMLAIACGLGSLSGHRPRAGLPEGLVLGALIVQLVQLVRLPIALLEKLDPATASIVQETFTAAGRGLSAHPLSLAPGETAVASAHLLLFGLALTLARREAASGRRGALLEGAMLAAGAVVGVVALHTVIGNEAIYGVVPSRGRGISFVLGPFVNSNHLAVFCCAVLPVVIAWTATPRALVARLAGAALAVSLAAIAIATVARSAILGLAVGLGVLFVLLAAAKKIRLQALALSAGALAVAVVGAILRTGGRALNPNEFRLMGDLSVRTEIWSTTLEVVRQHPMFGIGAGAFHSLAWSVRRVPSDRIAQDTESVLFQTLISLGIPATAVLLLGALVCFVLAARAAWARTREGDLASAGAFAGLCTLVVMSGVTLVSSQPALTILLAWLLGSLASPRESREPRLGRPLIVALAVGVCVLLAWGTPRTLAGTDRSFAAGEASDPVGVALRHPADPYGLAWAAEREVRNPDGRGLELLNRSMVLDPHGAEPHRVAVNVLLAAGLPAQARIEARLALTGATSAELPRFVEDALAIWPGLDDRLALLPAAPDRAAWVAKEIARQGGPELATEVWLELGQRDPPVPNALATGVGSLPRARSREAFALVEEGLRVAPEDIGLALVHAGLFRAAGDSEGAQTVLEQLLSRDDLSSGQRADALLQTGRMHLDEPEVLRELLARPTGEGAPEQATRAWLRGRVLEADGAVSQALRAYAEAARLRPDVAFFGAELIAFRARATDQPLDR